MRPPFLQNPHAWSTQRQAYDRMTAYAGSIYRPNWLERLYWKFLAR